MHGVGPGSLLGGRYVAHRRLSVDGRFERWSASDTVLDREISLLCLPATSPQAPAVLDAARRASAIEDPRLIRIFDVGADGGLRYVVEERVPQAQTLAELLTAGALPADEARRITGEVAVALERARLRGLHHQVLTPTSVLREPNGSIKVRGLAIEAALHEAEEPDSALAARRDTEAVVAIGYAALTTRWPLRTPYGWPDPGIDPAPRIIGGVAAPSEIAAGVPADLDLIARLTLREGRGPATPGDLANQIAPWPSQPVDLGAAPRPTLLPGPVVGSDTLTFAPGDLGVGNSASSTRALEPERAAPDAVPSLTEQAPTSEDRGELRVEGRAKPAEADEADEADDPLLSAREVLAKGFGAAVGAAGTLGSTVRDRVGTFARAAADKAAAAAERRGEPTGPAAGPTRSPGALPSTLLRTPPPAEEPPAPFLRSVPHTPTKDQSKLAIGALVALVIVAFVVALGNLPPIFGGASDRPAARPNTATSTRTASATATTSTGKPAAVVTRFTPTAVTAYDPEGDGQEGETTLPRAWDGDAATAWRSQWYVGANWGGFKSGLGLLVDLGATRSVTQVLVTLQGKQTAEVFVGSEPTKAKATSLGKVSATGTATFTAKAPSAGRYVVVWVTEPTPAEPGKYRAQIAEVVVNGRP